MNPLLLKEQKRILSERDALIKSLSKYAGEYSAALDEFAKIEIAFHNVTTDALNLTVTGTKHILNAAWGALRRAGFERHGERPAEGQTQFNGYFTHPSGAKVWLQFTSTSCRRVQIGTQLVEQAVYETVCDEMVL
jgi:hypothetical protein